MVFYLLDLQSICVIFLLSCYLRVKDIQNIN